MGGGHSADPRVQPPLPRLLRVLLLLGIPLLGLAAGLWLSYQGWRLVYQESPLGASDLWQRQRHLWMLLAGFSPYGGVDANYPPGSLMLLYPQIGWLSFHAARRLWAAMLLPLLSGLCLMGADASGASNRLERLFVMLTIVGHYAIGATVGNGQFGIHVLVGVFGLLLLLDRGIEFRGARLWAATLCVLLVLIKPHVGVLFVVLLPVFGAWRPTVLAASIYGGLTLWALALSRAPAELLQAWWQRALITASKDTQVAGPWLTLGSALAVLLLAVWCVRRRHADVWQLGAVLGLATLFVTFHRWYDDVLTLLPLIALLRAGRRLGWASLRGRGVAALVFLLLLVSVAPGGLYALPAAWGAATFVAQRMIWLLVLSVLLLAGDRPVVAS